MLSNYLLYYFIILIAAAQGANSLITFDAASCVNRPENLTEIILEMVDMFDWAYGQTYGASNIIPSFSKDTRRVVLDTFKVYFTGRTPRDNGATIRTLLSGSFPNQQPGG